MHIDANAWGSGILGAVIGSALTMWLTKLDETRRELQEQREYLDILTSELRECIEQTTPQVENNTQFATWPNRGCTIIGALIQTNLFNAPKYVVLIAQLRKLHSIIETYYSYRQIAATFVAGSIHGGTLEKNMAATHVMMASHFNNVTREAWNSLVIVQQIQLKKISLLSMFKKKERKITQVSE